MDYRNFHPVLSLLSYLCKAPLVPKGAPVVNSLWRQRAAIENVMRACLGLPPLNHMQLEHRGLRMQEGKISAKERIGEADGHVKGHVNGHANGYANGRANGHANGDANGHANDQANSQRKETVNA